MTIGAWGSEALMHGIQSLANWAWRASWQGAALAVVVGVLLWVAGKRISPACRFGLWGLVFARLAMPTLLEVNWKGSNSASERARVMAPSNHTVTPQVSSRIIEVEPDAAVALQSQSPGRIVPTASVAPGSALTHQTNSVNVALKVADPDQKSFLQKAWPTIKRFGGWAWLAGMALLTLRIVWSSARLARAVSRMKPIIDPRALDQLRACCGELGIKRIPQARELPGNGAPALVGFIRPRILLPQHVLDAMAFDELRLILLHELAHIKRRDVLINWIATLIAVIHWPNPAAWLVSWRMRVERELACDELVLRIGRDAGGVVYAKTIVKLVEALSGGDWRGRVPAPLPGGALGILEGKAQIQRRLLMIARFDAKSRRWPAVAAGLALLIGALALSGVTKAADKTADKPASAPPAAGGAEAQAKPRDPDAERKATKSAAEFLVASLKTSPPGGADVDNANARTAEKLKKPIPQIDFNGVGLSDAVDYIRDAAKIDILVEWVALEQVGITRDAPVTLRLREPASADAVLSLMFRAMGGTLQHEIDKGVVVISPSERKTATLMRVYDVSDLVSGSVKPVAAAPAPGTSAAPPGQSAAGAEGGPAPNPSTGNAEMDQLIGLVTSTVQPDAWAQYGGNAASIGVFKTKLVIKAGESIHKEVDGLLEALRDKPAGKSGRGAK